MKPGSLFGYSLMLVLILISAAALINKVNDVPEKHVEVVLRMVGDQLLHSANDSTSRVLPIKKLTENTYQISFENDFGFISDTLINIVQRTFKKNELADSYIINLKDCGKKETVLAFEINGKTGDIIPCRGRLLGNGCYEVEIELMRESELSSFWFLLLIIPMGFAGLYLKDQFRRKETQESILDVPDYIPLGKFQFFPSHNVLRSKDRSVSLSEKETKALEIFVKCSNQLVERDKLMKAIWEDEGTVVISRNVDVLVSKLRKKLSDDPSLKFVTVPGKGYKLMME